MPKNIKEKIKNLDNRCFISIASLWEIAVKTSLGKLELKSSFNKIAEFLSVNEIEILPIEFNHLQKLLNLEYHHRDPFDRIIIAQGLTENLMILTKDTAFSKYDADVMWK